MDEELDKLMKGSSHTLGIYINNQVLRGKIESLNKKIEDLENEIKILTDYSGILEKNVEEISPSKKGCTQN